MFANNHQRVPRDVTLTWPGLESFLPLGSNEPEPIIPTNYPRTVVYLLARDPQTLYAFWNISAHTYEEMKLRIDPKVWEHSQRVLRLYHPDGDPSEYQQFVVGTANSWYLTELNAGFTYRVELGLLDDGGFTPLAKSNPIQTPSNQVSSIIDEEWLTLDELYGLPKSESEPRSSFSWSGQRSSTR